MPRNILSIALCVQSNRGAVTNAGTAPLTSIRNNSAGLLPRSCRQSLDEVADKIDPFQKYLAPYIDSIEEANKEQAMLGK